MYANLRMFLARGVVQEVRPGEYDLTDRFKRHRHFKVCRVCGRRTAFFDSSLEKALSKVDGRKRFGGFAMEGHVLEVRGVCGLCRVQYGYETG